MATRYSSFIPGVTNGLVLYLDAAKRESYPGSGTTWYDLSGNGNNGTLTNGPTYTGVSKDAALDFDGSNDYVRINGSATSGQFDFNASSFSLNFWVKLSSYSNSQVIVKRNISLGFEAQITSNGTLSWFTNSSNGVLADTDAPESTALDLTKWYNCSFIFNRNDNTAKRFVNTQLVGNVDNISGLGNLGDNATDVSIGGRYARNDSYLDGNISQVQIYNRALTASEIQQNFNALKGRYGL